MTDDNADRDYEVGYGKTPVHSRFQRGRSGNPRGRQRGSKNGRTLLAEELALPVVFVENGRRKKTTKLGLIVKQASNKAVKGDNRELLQLIKCFGLDQQSTTVEAGQHALDSVEDIETQGSFLRRMRQTKHDQ